jgi:hypothetical protein
VLGDIRLALIRFRDDLADVLRALHQGAEDRQTRRVTERAEPERHVVEKFVGDVRRHGLTK